MADIELLAEQAETDRQDGFLYVRYAGWRDETRKKEGRGDFRFRRPDGGEIVADVLNDHKIQIHARSETRVRIYGNGRPRVRIARTGRFVDLLSYDGPVSELEREPYTVDVYADYILPAIERFERRARAAGKFGDRTGTTLNLQVGASLDDAYELESNGTMSTTGTRVQVQASTSASSRQWGGVRFQSVTVPAGATINSATLQIKPSFTAADDANFDIFFEDIDDAAAFSATAGDITGRTRTSASVAWVADSLGTAFVSSPDIATPLQEVIDRAGWASGQDLVGVLNPKTDATKNCWFVSYDSTPADAAKLDIDYTAGGGGDPEGGIVGGKLLGGGLLIGGVLVR